MLVPPGTRTVVVFAKLAGADHSYAGRFLLVAQSLALVPSALVSLRCCRAKVTSPLVRSSTPRTMSVVRRRPSVMASGRSTVTSREYMSSMKVRISSHGLPVFAVPDNIQHIAAHLARRLAQPVQVGRRLDAQFRRARYPPAAYHGQDHGGLRVFFLRVLHVARPVYVRVGLKQGFAAGGHQHPASFSSSRALSNSPLCDARIDCAQFLIVARLLGRAISRARFLISSTFISSSPMRCIVLSAIVVWARG